TDSIYNDSLELDGKWAKLNGSGFLSWANSFDRVDVNGYNGGANNIIRRSTHDFVFSQYGAWA
ncbi:MAG: hypothetical protein WD894_22035, partial [Pirellulales bacterium]